MAQPTSDQRAHLRNAIDWFRQIYLPEKYSSVYQRLPTVGELADMQSLYAEADQLSDLFMNSPVYQLMEIPEGLIPCLKLALVTYRRSEGGRIDKLKDRTNNPDILEKLEEGLASLDALLKESWVDTVSPKKMPRIADLLTIQDIERSRPPKASLSREYDEKFHILQAPQLFFEDLNQFRRQCEERGTNVIVCYLDIDDFKRINSRYGEIQVDRRVLPLFMQTLDAHVFHHGFAYRYGGDEYVIILPNLSQSLASNFFEHLRVSISQLSYRGVDEKITVSMGFCSVAPDSHFTDREIEEIANRAKNFAKDHGKNCIATYSGTNFHDHDLFVVAPQDNR